MNKCVVLCICLLLSFISCSNVIQSTTLIAMHNQIPRIVISQKIIYANENNLKVGF